jgi:hypothetical protein
VSKHFSALTLVKLRFIIFLADKTHYIYQKTIHIIFFYFPNLGPPLKSTGGRGKIDSSAPSLIGPAKDWIRN